MTTNKIPSVNLADFLSANVDKKNEFVQSIGRAFEEIGFVALNGHFLNSC
jgi:isopenicillin N synthase-like dioxygenase